MGSGNIEKHPKLLYSFIIGTCLVNLLILILIFLSIGDLKASMISSRIVSSIVVSKEDESFLKVVCRDLELESEVTIIVGPYYVPSFFSPHQNYKLDQLMTQYPVIVDPHDPTRRILMKESIYKELGAEEKRGLIAHEMWHIYSLIRGIVKPDVTGAVEADRFAIRYVSPDILIDLYKKYGRDDVEIQILIAELEKQKLASVQNEDAQ